MNERRDFDFISGPWRTSTDFYNYADFNPFEAGANTGCHGCGTGHALARHVCQHDVVILFSL